MQWGRLASVLGQKAPMFFEAVKKNKVNRAFVDSLDEYASKYPTLFKDADSMFDDASHEGIKSTLRNLHSRERVNHLTKEVREVTSSLVENEDKYVNTQNFFRERIDKANAGYEETHRLNVSSLERTLFKEGGEPLMGLYQMALDFPEKLESAFGVDQFKLFSALTDPETVRDNPLLFKLGKVFREWDKKILGDFQEAGLLGNIDDHTLPMKPNIDVIESMGKENFAKILYENTVNLDYKQALDLAADFFDRVHKSRAKGVSVKFPYRFLNFGQDDKRVLRMYTFLDKTARFSGETNMQFMSRMLNHKEDLVRKVFLFQEFGEDPEVSLKQIFSNLKSGEDDIGLGKLNKSEQMLLRTMEIAAGRSYSEFGTMRLYVEGVNKYISGTFGAAASLVRNWITDFAGHAVNFYEGLMDPDGAAKYFQTRITKPVDIMVRNLGSKIASGTPLSEQLHDMLDVMSFASTNNALFKSQGMRGQDLFMGAGVLTPGESKLESIGRTFNLAASKFSEFMHTVTGNTLHYDTVTAINVYNHAFAMSKMLFKHYDHKKFMEALGRKGSHYMRAVFDLGAEEYAALRDVYSTISGEIGVGEVRKRLGFKGGKVLVPDDILKMSDDTARQYKRLGETPKAFKQRLRMSYFNYLNDQRNVAQTALYRTNKIIDRGLQKGSFADILLRPFTPFFNITHAQNFNLRKGISLALYGSPFNVDFNAQVLNKRGAVRWGRTIGFYTGLSVGVTWTKDILYGKTPRNITDKELALIMAGSGVLGIPGSIIQSVGFKTLGKNYYSSTPQGALMAAGFDSVTNLDNPYKAVRAFRDFTGVGRIWYAKGLVDYTLRQAFLSPMAKREQDEWYDKNYGQSFLFK